MYYWSNKTPAAPAGSRNVTFQGDGGSPEKRSAYVGPASDTHPGVIKLDPELDATKVLKGDGSWGFNISLPPDGEEGQVLGKLSGESFDVGWIDMEAGTGGGDPVVKDLTFTSPIYLNGNQGDIFTLTASGNFIIGNPYNFQHLQRAILIIWQDEVGEHIISDWGNKIKFHGESPMDEIILETTPNSMSMIGLMYDANQDLFHIIAFEPHYAGEGDISERVIATAAPLQGGGDLSGDRLLYIDQADAETDGYLSSIDWNLFNEKVPSDRTINGHSLATNITLITADVNPSTNRNYVTDAQLTAIDGNTGDETAITLGEKIAATDEKVDLVDGDKFAISDSEDSDVLRHITFEALKAKFLGSEGLSGTLAESLSGSGTWYKNQYAKMVIAFLVAGGGGGGGGTANTSYKLGAGGGGGGGCLLVIMPASLLPSSMSYSVGAGGAGASGGNPGGTGNPGGDTTFGDFTVYGGGGGGHSTTSNQNCSGGGGGGTMGKGANGNSGSSTAVRGGYPAPTAVTEAYCPGGGGGRGGSGASSGSPGCSEYGGGGGGGGKSGSSCDNNGGSSKFGPGGGGGGDNGNFAPGAGGKSNASAPGGGGAAGTTGTNPTVAGTDGAPAGSGKLCGDGGGGGGTATGAGVAGSNGGKGGFPGGGGGGGGGALTGATAGNGGDGGDGTIVVIQILG